MKRFYLLIALLLSLPFAESCAQPKEIRTVAILGDSYSTFDGYIPEGNACWYFTTPQGDNDVVLFCHPERQRRIFRLKILHSTSFRSE